MMMMMMMVLLSVICSDLRGVVTPLSAAPTAAGYVDPARTVRLENGAMGHT
jgi:hypothetical protein